MIHFNKIYFLIFFVTFAKTSYEQDMCNDIKLLRIACDSAIENQIIAGEQVIYTDRLSSWKWLRENINSDDTFGKHPKPIIVLSKKDKKSILEQIKTFEHFKWEDSLFENSKRIDLDSMLVLINRENRKRYIAMLNAATIKDTNTINKLKYIRTNVYSFSKPLYIRNNSVALIGFAWMCGAECGHNEVAFYKKENGNWVRWVIISQGDF